MAWTKKAKPTENYTKIEKPFSEKLARFGMAKFGKAKFAKVDTWTRTVKPTENYTKEAKPAQ